MNLNINVLANTKNAEKSFAGFYSKLKTLNSSLVNINKDANRSASGFKNLATSFSFVNQAIGMSGLLALAYQLKLCIQSAMDMNETINLFNVSLGDMAEKTNTAVESLSEMSGLDLTNLQNAVGTYALLARSMGMTSEQASVLSMNTTKLAIDLSSLTNVPVNQVMQDLRSGLLGQSETVYKYGMDVTEAGLKTEAMRQGIQKSVRDMSQGEKMALRYAVMIRTSGIAQGDFARTIDQPANQLRILQERITTLARSIGTIFIPMLSFILPYLNAFVQVLTEVANAIAKFFGYEKQAPKNVKNNPITGITEDAIDAGNAVDDTTDSIKKMKQSLLGIDEINLLPKDTGDTGKKPKGSKGGAGIDGNILPSMELPSYDNLMSGIKSKSTEIANTMRNFLKNFVAQLDFTNLIFAFDKLSKALKPLTETIGQGLIWLWYNVFVPMAKWTIEDFLPTFINTLANALYFLDNVIRGIAPSLQNLWDEILVPIFSWTGDITIKSLAMLGRMFITSSDEVVNGVNSMISSLIKLSKTASDVFVRNILPFVKNVFGNIVDIFIKFFDTGEMVFDDLWNDVVYPVLKNFISVGIPFIEDFVEKFVDLVDSLFNDVKRIFDTLWSQGVKPALDIIVKIWTDMIIIIVNFYNQQMKPIFDQMKLAFSNTATEFLRIWNDFIKPVWDRFADAVNDLWDNHLKNLLNQFLYLAGTIANCALQIYNTFISPLIGWISRNLAPQFRDSFSYIIDVLHWVLSVASDVVANIMRIFSGLINFLTGAFTGNWRQAWQGVKDIMSGIFGVIGSLFRGIANALIDRLNSFLYSIESYINRMVDGINGLIDKWNWVKGRLGISDWTYHIGYVHYGRVPYLATGGSLEEGQLFRAGEFGKAEMVGNYNGKTTVMPLENTDFVSAMYSAVFDAVSSAMDNGSGESGDLVLKVGENEFGRVAINSINNITRREGRLALKI